jgi:GNAT superfamily N-acetyltransferase
MQRPCPLEKGHNTNNFDCGNEALNLYLKRYARQNEQREAARTYVVFKNDRVVGYYTLVYGSISWDKAPESLRAQLGKYPIPSLVIAKLAVDLSEQGSGLGDYLLQDALVRAIRASEIAGLRAVIVDAKTDAAKRFYEKHGFYVSPYDPMQLFMPMPELKKSRPIE